jgi:hypothetical protein
MKYDVERAVSDILEIIKANLNDKIDEIQSEKDTLLGSANFSVDHVGADAYFDSLDERVANYNPFIYYGIENTEVIGEKGATIESMALFFLVVLHNTFEDANISKRVLRYNRALKEIIEENFGQIRDLGGLRVTTLKPADMKDLHTSHFHKVGGIIVNTELG